MATVDQTPTERTAGAVVEASLTYLPKACLVGCKAVAACRRGFAEGYRLQDEGSEAAAVSRLEQAGTSLAALRRVTLQAHCTEPAEDGQCTNGIINAAQNAG